MRRTIAALLAATSVAAQEVRPGVWAGGEVSALPVPVSGYQVYLIGELHGLRETGTIFEQYLAMLHGSARLRDVAIEEDAVYERDAQAYVEGRSENVPEQICLRAGLLRAVRRFNQGKKADERVRVHLVDIDSPAEAISRHLAMLKEQAPGVRVSREMRTIEHSIRAYEQGFEVGNGQSKGSPYLDEREQAITSNIQDLLRGADCPAVLAVYGSDHVSRALRKDGGPKRDSSFAPMALRLEEGGLKVFSLVAFPLAGRSSWRGREFEMPYTAADGALASGETLDRVLAAAGQPKLLYVDRAKERIRLASQDATRYAVDAYLLIASGTPMENRCATR